MTYHVVCLQVCLVVSSACFGETIMDQIGMVFDQSYRNANGNAIGGERLWGDRIAIQLCDDFRTTWTGFIITEVQVGNVAFTSAGFADARISVFPYSDGRPLDDPVFTAKVSELGLALENVPFEDGVFGGYGFRSIVRGLSICLKPDSRYYIDVQVYSGPDDWAYTVRVRTYTGTDSFVRDGPPDEGEGEYGTTSWITAEDGGVGAGDSAYQVEAIGGDPCPGDCTEGERIARAVCRARNLGNKLAVRLTGGVPEDPFKVDLATGEMMTGTLDAEGQGRVRFKGLPSGEGTATATWACGAHEKAAYSCP